MHLHRLARALIRLYPRPWRARYEDEFVALLEDTGATWHVVVDIVRGVLRERALQAWRAVIGREVGALPPLRWTRALGSFTALMAVGWVVGRQLDPFVSDALHGLQWLPLILLSRLKKPPAQPGAPTAPVYVVHPFRPARLLHVRMPPWLRVTVRVVFWFPIALRWIPLPRVPTRAARWFAGACVFVFACMTFAAPWVVRLGGTSTQFFAWMMVLMMLMEWFEVVGENHESPPAPATSSG